MRTAEYLDLLQSKGYSTFTTHQFAEAFSLSKDATKMALHRLRKKGKIATPVHEFHVIVSPEFRYLGCLPAEHIIDSVMKHVGSPYYVGLLSAAEKYGAAHQRPQRLQVMVERKRRDIICGSVGIQFIQRRELLALPVVEKNVRTGTIRVSTPELTAFDLVGFPIQSGGMQHVLTVLSELTENLHPGKLQEVAKLCPVHWSQRLGVLISMLRREDLSKGLLRFVREKARNYIPLVLGKNEKGAGHRDPQWRVVINAELERDEV